MIVRLISSIVALVIIAFFAGFNLENKCDVNLLFYTFKDAPVFFTVVFSFLYSPTLLNTVLRFS